MKVLRRYVTVISNTHVRSSVLLPRLSSHFPNRLPFYNMNFVYVVFRYAPFVNFHTRNLTSLQVLQHMCVLCIVSRTWFRHFSGRLCSYLCLSNTYAQRDVSMCRLFSPFGGVLSLANYFIAQVLNFT